MLNLPFLKKKTSFIGDGAIYSKIRDMISESKELLALVSPYININDDFLREIESACLRGVDVTIVFRRDMLSKYQTEDWLKKLNNAGAFIGHVDRLHSKIYFNESFGILTSMNLNKSSGENSFEAGILIDTNHALSEEIVKYMDDLERHIEPAEPAKKPRRRDRWSSRRKGTSSNPRASPDTRTKGNCIRCKSEIPFNSKRPYCAEDYVSWSKFSNDDYADQHCHGCGISHPATMRKPLCPKCYKAHA